MINGIIEDHLVNKCPLVDRRQHNLTQYYDVRKTTGRVSRSAAFKLKLLRLQNDHVSGVADNIVDYLVRYLCNVPDHTKRNPDFIRHFRTAVEFLNDYRYNLQKANKRFAYSRTLVVLLTKYVLLERDGLYALRTHSIKYERDLERNVLRLLQNICMDPSKDNTHPYISTVRALHVLQEVVNSYKENGKFVDNMIRRLLCKMGLLEKFDNYHNDRDALTSKELDLLSSGSCYDNVLVKDKIEMCNNIPTASFNGKFYDEKLLMPKPLKQEETDTSNVNDNNNAKDNQYESDSVLDSKDLVSLYRQTSNLCVDNNNVCDNSSTNVNHFKNYFSQILDSHKFSNDNDNSKHNNRRLPHNNNNNKSKSTVVCDEEITTIEDDSDEEVVLVDVKKELPSRNNSDNNSKLIILNPESFVLSSDDDDDDVRDNVRNDESVMNVKSDANSIAQLNIQDITNDPSHNDNVTNINDSYKIPRIIINENDPHDRLCGTDPVIPIPDEMNAEQSVVTGEDSRETVNMMITSTIESNIDKFADIVVRENITTDGNVRDIINEPTQVPPNNSESPLQTTVKEETIQYNRLTLKNKKYLFPSPSTSDDGDLHERDRINEDTLLNEFEDSFYSEELSVEDEEELLLDNVTQNDENVDHFEIQEESPITECKEDDLKNFNKDVVPIEKEKYSELSSLKSHEVSYVEDISVTVTSEITADDLEVPTHATEIDIELPEIVVNSIEVGTTEVQCCDVVSKEELVVQNDDDLMVENEEIITEKQHEDVVPEVDDETTDDTRRVEDESHREDTIDVIKEQIGVESQIEIIVESQPIDELLRQNDEVNINVATKETITPGKMLEPMPTVIEATEDTIEVRYEDVEVLSSADATETCHAIVVEQENLQESSCIGVFIPEEQTSEKIKSNFESIKSDTSQSEYFADEKNQETNDNDAGEGVLEGLMLLVNMASSREKVEVVHKEAPSSDKVSDVRQDEGFDIEVKPKNDRIRNLKQMNRRGRRKEDTKRKCTIKATLITETAKTQTKRTRVKNVVTTDNTNRRVTRKTSEIISLKEEQQPNTFNDDKYFVEEPAKKIYASPPTDEITSAITSDDSNDDKLFIAISGSETEMDKEDKENKVEEEANVVTISIPDNADVIIADENSQDDTPLLQRLTKKKRKDSPSKQKREKKSSESTLEKKHTSNKGIGSKTKTVEVFDSLTLYENAVEFFNTDEKVVVVDDTEAIGKKQEKSVKTKAAMKEYKDTTGTGENDVNKNGSLSSAIVNELTDTTNTETAKTSNAQLEQVTPKTKGGTDNIKKGKKKQKKTAKQDENNRIENNLTSIANDEEPINLSIDVKSPSKSPKKEKKDNINKSGKTKVKSSNQDASSLKTNETSEQNKKLTNKFDETNEEFVKKFVKKETELTVPIDTSDTIDTLKQTKSTNKDNVRVTKAIKRKETELKSNETKKPGSIDILFNQYMSKKEEANILEENRQKEKNNVQRDESKCEPYITFNCNDIVEKRSTSNNSSSKLNRSDFFKDYEHKKLQKEKHKKLDKIDTLTDCATVNITNDESNVTRIDVSSTEDVSSVSDAPDCNLIERVPSKMTTHNRTIPFRKRKHSNEIKSDHKPKSKLQGRKMGIDDIISNLKKKGTTATIMASKLANQNDAISIESDTKNSSSRSIKPNDVVETTDNSLREITDANDVATVTKIKDDKCKTDEKPSILTETKIEWLERNDFEREESIDMVGPGDNIEKSVIVSVYPLQISTYSEVERLKTKMQEDVNHVIPKKCSSKNVKSNLEELPSEMVVTSSLNKDQNCDAALDTDHNRDCGSPDDILLKSSVETLQTKDDSKREDDNATETISETPEIVAVEHQKQNEDELENDNNVKPMLSEDVQNVQCSSAEETLVNEDAAMVNAEETMVNEEVAMVNAEETMVNEEVAMVNAEETMVNVQVAMVNTEEIMVNEEVAIVNAEETMLNEEAAMINVEETMANAKETMLNVEETMVTEELTMVNEEERMESETCDENIETNSTELNENGKSIELNIDQNEPVIEITLSDTTIDREEKEVNNQAEEMLSIEATTNEVDQQVEVIETEEPLDEKDESNLRTDVVVIENSMTKLTELTRTEEPEETSNISVELDTCNEDTMKTGESLCKLDSKATLENADVEEGTDLEQQIVKPTAMIIDDDKDLSNEKEIREDCGAEEPIDEPVTKVDAIDIGNQELSHIDSYVSAKEVISDFEVHNGTENVLDVHETCADEVMEIELTEYQFEQAATCEINDESVTSVQTKVTSEITEEVVVVVNDKLDDSHEEMPDVLIDGRGVNREEREDVGQNVTIEMRQEESTRDVELNKESDKIEVTTESVKEIVESAPSDEQVDEEQHVAKSNKNDLTLEEVEERNETIMEYNDTTSIVNESSNINTENDNEEEVRETEQNVSNDVEICEDDSKSYALTDNNVEDDTVYTDRKKLDEETIEIDENRQDLSNEEISTNINVIEGPVVEINTNDDEHLHIAITNEGIQHEASEIFISKEIDFNNEIIVNMSVSDDKEYVRNETVTVTLHEATSFVNTLKDAAENISSTTNYVSSDTSYITRVKNREVILNDETLTEKTLEEPCNSIQEPCNSIVVESCNSIQETCSTVPESSNTTRETCNIIEVPCNNVEEPCSSMEDPCEATVVVSNCDPSVEEITNFIQTYVGDTIQKETTNVVNNQSEKSSKSYYVGQENNDHEYYGPADLLVSGKCDKDLKRTSVKDCKNNKNMDTSLEDTDRLYLFSEDIGTLMVANVPVGDVQMDAPTDYVLNETDNQLTFNFIGDELNQPDTITIDDGPDDTPEFPKLNLKNEREDYHEDDWTTQSITKNVHFINENLPPDAIEQYEQYETDIQSFAEGWNNDYVTDKSITANGPYHHHHREQFTTATVENCNLETVEITGTCSKAGLVESCTISEPISEPVPTMMSVSITDTMSITGMMSRTLTDSVSGTMTTSMPVVSITSGSMSTSIQEPVPVSDTLQVSLSSSRSDIKSDINIAESVRTFPLTDCGFSDIDNFKFLPSFENLSDDHNGTNAATTSTSNKLSDLPTYTNEPKKYVENVWPSISTKMDLVSRCGSVEKKTDTNRKENNNQKVKFNEANTKKYGPLINMYNLQRKSISVNNIKQKIAQKLDANFPVRVNSRTPVVSSNKKPSPPQTISSSPPQCVTTSNTQTSLTQTRQTANMSSTPDITTLVQNTTPLTQSMTLTQDGIATNATTLAENLTSNTDNLSFRENIEDTKSSIPQQVKSPRLLMNSPTMSNRVRQLSVNTVINNKTQAIISKYLSSPDNTLPLRDKETSQDVSRSRNLMTGPSAENMNSSVSNNNTIDDSNCEKNDQINTTTEEAVENVLNPIIRDKCQRRMPNKSKESIEDTALTKNKTIGEVYENKYDIIKLRQRQSIESKNAAKNKQSEPKAINQKASIVDKQQREVNDDKRRKRDEAGPSKRIKLNIDDSKPTPSTSNVHKMAEYLFDDFVKKENSKAKQQATKLEEKDNTKNVDMNVRKRKLSDNTNDESDVKRQKESSKNNNNYNNNNNQKPEEVKKHYRESTPSKRELYSKKEYEASRDSLFNPECNLKKDYSASKDKKLQHYQNKEARRREEMRKEEIHREELRKEDRRRRDCEQSSSTKNYFSPQLRKELQHQLDDKRRRSFDMSTTGKDILRPPTTKTNQGNDYTRHIDANPQKSCPSDATTRNEHHHQGLGTMSNLRVVDPKRNPNGNRKYDQERYDKYYRSQQNVRHPNRNHKGSNTNSVNTNPNHFKSHYPYNNNVTNQRRYPMPQYTTNNHTNNKNVSQQQQHSNNGVNGDTNWINSVSEFLGAFDTASDALIPKARRKQDQSVRGNSCT